MNSKPQGNMQTFWFNFKEKYLFSVQMCSHASYV